MKRKTKLRIWSLFNADETKLLRTPSEPVELARVSTAEFQELIDDMFVTMRQAKGIGLAAPQVGQPIRLAIIAEEVDPQLPEPLTMINPQIVSPSLDQEVSEEGCLSIVGVFGDVQRATNITVRAFDRAGKPYTLKATNLLARAIQHEVDHLNGILFTDKATIITKGQDLLS